MSCRVENLSIYMNRKILIENMNFTFESGKKYFIFGQIGLGKTTLLETLAGFHKEYTGHFFWDPPITKKSFLFQKNTVLPWLTVEENFKMILSKDDIEKSKDLFKYLNIEELMTKKSSYLSGGELQKINFARAMALDPEIVFADEPFNSLDIKQKNMLENYLIGHLKKKQGTLIWVSHDIVEIKKNADHVLCFSKKKTCLKKILSGRDIQLNNLSDFILSEI